MMIMYVETDRLKPNPNNLFDPLPPDEYQELKCSINKYGVKEPLIVCHNTNNGYYTILCGHNRQRAAIDLSIPTLPCILVQTEEAETVIDTEIYRRMLTKEQRRELIAKKDAIQKEAISRYLEANLLPALKTKYEDGMLKIETALRLAGLPANTQSEAYNAMVNAQETVIIKPADPEQQARHAQEVASMQKQVDEHKSEAETLKAQMKDMERRLRDLNKQKDKAREMIEEQQENIARLKEQSYQEAKESLRAEVEDRIRQARQQIDEANRAVGEKNMEIDRLHEEIERQKRRVFDTETLVKSAEVSAKMFRDDCVAKLKLLYSPKIIKTSLDNFEHSMGCLASYLSSNYAWDDQTMEEVEIRLRRITQQAKEVLRNIPARTPLQLPKVTPMLPEDQQQQ